MSFECSVITLSTINTHVSQLGFSTDLCEYAIFEKNLLEQMRNFHQYPTHMQQSVKRPGSDISRGRALMPARQPL